MNMLMFHEFLWVVAKTCASDHWVKNGDHVYPSCHFLNDIHVCASHRFVTNWHAWYPLHSLGVWHALASWHLVESSHPWAPPCHSLEVRNYLVQCHSLDGGQVSVPCQSLGNELALVPHVLRSRHALAPCHSLENPPPWASHCPVADRHELAPWRFTIVNMPRPHNILHHSLEVRNNCATSTFSLCSVAPLMFMELPLSCPTPTWAVTCLPALTSLLSTFVWHQKA